VAWAARQTTWLNFGRDVLPTIAGALATYLVAIAVAPAGTPLDQRAVGFPLIAGAVALVLALALSNLAAFLRNVGKAGARMGADREEASQTALITTSKDAGMLRWVADALTAAGAHVAFAAAFGSVLASFPTRDVDVIIQFSPVADSTIRKSSGALKGVCRTFRAEFGLGLHIQTFAYEETDALVAFVLRAGKVEVLIGADRWAEISIQRT
jgi:hypothetical protein